MASSKSGSGRPDLRVWTKGSAGWETVPVEGGLHGLMGSAGVRDLLDVLLKTGREPELTRAARVPSHGS